MLETTVIRQGTREKSCAQACYQCLLSYSNQFDRALLNRHLIHNFLVQLQSSVINIELDTTSREAQYQKLWEQTDPNSSFEREVLKEIYQRGIKLPDSAQELIPEANCKPDFLYHKYKVAIFCDGSVHSKNSNAIALSEIIYSGADLKLSNLIINKIGKLN